MNQEYIPLSTSIKNTHGSNPLLSADFILNPNRTPDPMGDSYLSAMVAHCLGDCGAAINLPMDQKHKDYLQSIGLNANSQLHFEVGQNADRFYPNGSCEAAFLNSPNEVKNRIRSLLHQAGNYSFYPNFITDNAVAISKVLEIPFGNVVEHEQENAILVSNTAHSKAFLRAGSEKFDYKIAIGKVINCNGGLITPMNLQKSIFELVEQVKERHNLNNEDLNKLEFWFKLDDLSGGDGVVNISTPFDLEKCENIVKRISNIIEACDRSPENFSGNLILEAGINSIEGIEIISNINAQALIGKDGKLTHFDTSVQMTDQDGNYLGNTLPYLDQVALQSINREFQKLANHYYEMGYCGLMGGDAMVIKTNQGYDVVWFDMNTRMNGSQAFQEHYRLANSVRGGMHSLNINLIFAEGVRHQDAASLLGHNLFTFHNNRGVIPTLYRSNSESLERVVKASIVGNSQQDLNQIIAELKAKEINI